MRKRARKGSKKRRADATRKSDGGLLDRIIEASPTGITVVNRDGQITFANRRAEQILGLKKSEIVGRKYNSPKWRITTYDGQPYPGKDLPFQRVKATGKPVFDVRHAIQWPDGQRVLLSINGASLFDQSGRFDGMVAVVTDITSYVQSVSKLRESEERYRVLFEKSPIGIGTATLDGKVVSANEAMQAITGHSEKELKKISLADMYENPEERKRLLEVISRRGSIANCLVRKKRKNGTTYEAVLNVSPIHAPSGDLLQTTCIDVTEPRRLQKELEKSKRFLEEVMDAIPDLLFIRDEDLKYAYVNKAVSDFFGKSKGELLGKTAYDLYPRQAASENQRTDMEVLQKGIQIDRPELTARDMKGIDHVLQARKAPLRDSEGNVTHIIAISRDITGRKQMEEEIRSLARFPLENPNPILRMSRDGVVVDANPASEALLRSWGSKIGGRAPKTWLDLILKGFESQSPRSFDAELGDKVYLFTVVPVKDVDYVNVYGRDVTDRRRMEEQYRRLLEDSMDSISVTIGQKLAYVNKRFATLLGFNDPQQLIDRDFAEFIVPEDREKVIARSLGRQGGEKHPPKYDFTLLRADGTKIEVETNATVIEFEGKVAVLSIMRDITERKRMEGELRVHAQELQMQNMKLREAEALGRIGNWEYHVDSQRIVWSDGTYVLYERDPALGPPTAKEEAEYYSADQAKMLRDYAARSIQDGQEFRYDLEAILPSGRKLFTASMSPVRDETGRVVRLFGTVQDITERRRMEEELRVSEKKFRQLVETAQEGIWTIDAEGKTLYANPRMAELLGYDVEELLGKPLSMFMDDTGAKIAEQNLEQGRQVVKEQYGFEFIRKDGSRLYASSSISPLTDDGGNPIGALALVSDVTERKRMENELRRQTEHLEELVEERTKRLQESEERFRGIAERSFDMIATLDLNGSIRYVSPAVMWITGYSSEEMLGQHFQSYLPEEDVAKEMGAFMEAAKGKIVRTQPLKIKRKDGSIVHIEVNASPVFSDEKIAGIQAIARDVTERFNLAEMRERFISTVTHELRTPLASIKGYLDLILTEAPAGASSEIQSSLQVVKRNADRLLSLTNDLLDIQRMTAGRFQLSMGAVDLKKIMEQSNSDILPTVTERKQNLILEVPDELPEIQGDPVRLGQVFANLLSNASKFSPEGGNITLCVKEEKDTIRTQVSDGGIGIKKEDLAHIFEPFTTVQKPSYIRGTGLGLSITKGILEAHGGKIWAESQGEGKGATFTFTLPKTKKED